METDPAGVGTHVEITTLTPAAYGAAFIGGLISFLSPCVLPIVPGYLSLITGLDLADERSGGASRSRRITIDTLGFIAGFTAVFMLLGVTASALGGALLSNEDVLRRLSGGMVMAMGLFMVGSLFLQAPWLYSEHRFEPDLGRFGRAAPPVAGAAFGFGWTPCIGPVLASILAIAATSGRATAGATLLLVYSIGLGVPFLLTGLLFGRAAGSIQRLNRHLPKIVGFSGVALAVLGALLVLDRLTWVTSQLQQLLDLVGLDLLVELG